MAKKNRKFRLNREVWIEPDMMASEAFRSLSRTAVWVLLRFLQKRTWTYMGQGGRRLRVYENSGLTFTYPEANHFGISDSPFYRSIVVVRLVRAGTIHGSDCQSVGENGGHLILRKKVSRDYCRKDQMFRAGRNLKE